MSESANEQETADTADATLAPRPVQDEAWAARALALARETALPAQELSQGTRDTIGSVQRYGVVSAKGAHLYHVERALTSGEWFCSCPAGTYGRACKHVGAVMNLRYAHAQAKRIGRDCPECAGHGALADASICPSCDGTGWRWLPT